MVLIRLGAVLGAVLAASIFVEQAGSPKPHAQFTTCRGCVSAGFGWSEKKQRCGGFANKECAPAAAAAAAAAAQPAAGAAAEVCSDPAVPMDEEAALYEAERVEVDRANMADAIRIAAELSGSGQTAESIGRESQCDRQKENKAMTLRCPGHNVIEAV